MQQYFSLFSQTSSSEHDISNYVSFLFCSASTCILIFICFDSRTKIATWYGDWILYVSILTSSPHLHSYLLVILAEMYFMVLFFCNKFAVQHNSPCHAFYFSFACVVFAMKRHAKYLIKNVLFSIPAMLVPHCFYQLFRGTLLLSKDAAESKCMTFIAWNITENESLWD